MNPLWSRSPFVLTTFPGLLAGFSLGALLLAASLALGPLYLSAVASGSLQETFSGTNRYGSGFFMQRQGVVDQYRGRTLVHRNFFDVQTKMLDKAAAPIAHLSPVLFTILSQDIQATHAGGSFTVRLTSRERSRRHLDIVQGTARGFTIPDTVAHDLHVSPGDKLKLTYDTQSTQLQQFVRKRFQSVNVVVSGIYHNLLYQTDEPYWSNLADDIEPSDPNDPPPPPFVIGTQGKVADLLRRLHQQTTEFHWELPLNVSPPLTVQQATTTARELNALSSKVADPGNPLGHAFYCAICRFGIRALPSQGVGLSGEIKQVEDRLTALRPPVQSISGAGALVALAVTTSAGVYSGRRRRSETMLFLARGFSATWIGVRSAVESIIPIVMGAAVGLFLARWLVSTLANAPTDASAFTESLVRIGVAIPIALVVLFIVAYVGAKRLLRQQDEVDLNTRIIPWEAAVAVGAVATYLLVGDNSISFAGNKAAVATYVLLGFPLLVLLAASGVIARVFRWSLARSGEAAERMKAAFFLAVNRLGVSTTIAIALLIAASTSLGLFVYSQAMVSSLGETALAKASVFVGGDATVPEDFGYIPPRSFGLPTTSVEQINSAATFGNQNVGLLLVDPKTFARAARWNDAFSSTPLPEMMKAISATNGSKVAFVAVDSSPLAHAKELSLQGVGVPVKAVATATAFPAIFGDTPWAVMSADRIQSVVEKAGGTNPLTLGGVADLIVKGDPQKATLALRGLGFAATDVLTTDRILRQPTYVAAQSTLKVLRALGVAAGLLSVLAILLYLQVRQRERSLANALSVRMGLGESQHLLAVALEIGAILLLASIIALAGGFFVAAMTHSWLDPVPRVPPSPLLVLPMFLIPILILACVVVSFIGAGLAQWSSSRTDLAGEMRRVG